MQVCDVFKGKSTSMKKKQIIEDLFIKERSDYKGEVSLLCLIQVRKYMLILLSFLSLDLAPCLIYVNS